MVKAQYEGYSEGIPLKFVREQFRNTNVYAQNTKL